MEMRNRQGEIVIVTHAVHISHVLFRSKSVTFGAVFVLSASSQDCMPHIHRTATIAETISRTLEIRPVLFKKKQKLIHLNHTQNTFSRAQLGCKKRQCNTSHALLFTVFVPSPMNIYRFIQCFPEADVRMDVALWDSFALFPTVHLR